MRRRGEARAGESVARRIPPSLRSARNGHGAPALHLAAAALLAVAWSVAGPSAAAAHGSLIRGSVTLAPDPPQPGQAMVLTIDLANASDRPVEGATLVADLKAQAPAGSATSPASQTIPLQEYKEPYGTYRAEATAPPAGDYTLTVHDRTEKGEDTTADVPLRIGGKVANGSLGFTFPGGVGGSHPLTTWLLWLIGVPLAVAVVVTILVRRSTRGEAELDRGEG